MRSKLIIKEWFNLYLPLILMFLLVEFTKTETCSIQCADTPSFCTVCFQVCQQQSNSFYNCSQTYTDASSQTSVFIFGEAECSQKCCSPQLSNFGLQLFYSCHDKQQMSRIQAIVIGCLMTIIVTCLCICCCNKRVREKMAACLCPENIKQSKDINKNSQSHDNLDNAIKEKTEIMLQIPESHECSICLKSECNISTDCGHCFHLNCLIYSYSKSKQCPDCLTSQLELIRLYCDNCHSYLGREAKLSMIEEYQIQVNRQSICENCSSYL